MTRSKQEKDGNLCVERGKTTHKKKVSTTHISCVALTLQRIIFHYQACPISTTNLVRFLFDSHAYLPAVAQTRPTDSDKGLMLAASANLITKSTPTFVMEIGQAWQWNIPRLPAYTQSVHAPVLTRPLGSNKHPHSLAVCPSLRNARYVVTGQTTIHDGHSTFP